MKDIRYVFVSSDNDSDFLKCMYLKKPDTPSPKHLHFMLHEASWGMILHSCSAENETDVSNTEENNSKNIDQDFKLNSMK